MEAYHSINQSSNNNRQKFATIQDLDRLSFSILKNPWSGMSNKANILLSYFVAVSSIGHNGLSVPIEYILDSLNKRIGYSCSRSTLFRALSELNKHGFIRSHKYRVGKDRFETKIEFLDAIRFVKNANKPNGMDMSHISPQVSNCDETTWTSNNTRVNSPNHPDIYKKPRERASGSFLLPITGESANRGNVPHEKAKSTPRREEPHSEKTPQERKRPKLHPAIYCARVNTTGPDTKFILARIAFELAFGGDFPGHSGVPWESYRWHDMTNSEKDSLYRREILPMLRSRINLSSPTFDLESLASPPAVLDIPRPKHSQDSGGTPPNREWTSEEIRAEISRIASKSEEKEEVTCHEPTEISLSDKELELLSKMRDEARKKASMW